MKIWRRQSTHEVVWVFIINDQDGNIAGLNIGFLFDIKFFDSTYDTSDFLDRSTPDPEGEGASLIFQEK